jgi:RND family efflux transporter MFP subunit
MYHRHPGRGAGIAIYVTLLMTIAGCKKPVAPPAPPPPAVTVAKPIEREVIEWDEYDGRLAAAEMVELRARVSGFIDKAEFDEGAIVKAGQVLFVIDARPFEAELAKAQADVARARAQEAYTANDYRRLEGLRPTGGASEFEVETAKQKWREAQAEIAAGEAQVRVAQLNVEWCRVTAPISGRISRKNVTAGNLITGGGTGQGTATVLTTITSIDPIYAYMDVDEQSVLKYQRLAREGKRASARQSRVPIFMGLASEEGFPHEGVVDFVDNRIDAETGTQRARGIFANPNGYLTPGMGVRLRVPGSGRYRTLLVPDAAVGLDQNQHYLLLVKPDDTVERHNIEPGALFGRLRSIPEGLGPDDRVIVNGLQKARPGAKVAATVTEISDSTYMMIAPGSATTRDLPATRHLHGDAATTAPAQPTSAPAPAPSNVVSEVSR